MALLDQKQPSDGQPLLFRKRSYEDRFVGYDKMAKYYAGSDVLVYFNTVWVPEITSIQFQAGPKDAPVFSYSHEHFNAVTKGTFIVSGQITMNFVETGYLNKVFRTVWNDVLDKSYFTNTHDSIVDKDRFDRAVDTLLARTERELTFRDVEAAKKVLKQRIWGISSNSFASDKYMYRPDQLTAAKSFADIDANGNTIYKTIPPINLMILYGNPKGKHEVKKLTDIRLLEYGQTIHNDGTPIQEVYTFIARDMDNPEDVSGVSAIGANDNQLNIDAVSLTKMMADSLFAFLARDTSFRVRYDSKQLFEKDSYTFVNSKDYGQYVYQGKDHLSLSLMHGFTFPIDYLSSKKIGPFGEMTEKDMESIRAQTLSNMLMNQKDITAKKFYDKDAENLLPSNYLLGSDLVAYTAAVLDRIAYINPYYTAYNTKIISRFLPQDPDVIESGKFTLPIVKKSEFTLRPELVDRCTYSHMLFEKLLINVDDADAREFKTLTVSGSNIAQWLDINTTTSILGEAGNQRAYRSFELLRANEEIHRTNISSGQMRMLSLLNAGLDTLPKKEGTENDDISRLRAVYALPEDYSKDGIIVYDPAGKPMVNGIKPITPIVVGGDYYLQFRDKDGIAYTDFPLPVSLQNKTNIECIVFIDNGPGYAPDGMVDGIAWINFQLNSTNNTFSVHIQKTPKAITTETLFKIILIDKDLYSIADLKTYMTTARYTTYKSKYYANREHHSFRKADNTYLYEKSKELSQALGERILGTRLAATIAVPIYSIIESPFTGNTVKQYINRLIAYSTKFQYKFDFQYFVDAFISDLQNARIPKTGSTLTNSRKFANINVDLIRQTFRDRFLKIYDNYYTPASINISLIGTNRRNVIVTGEYTSPPTSFITEAIKSTEKQTEKQSNLLSLNYSIIDIDNRGSRTLVGCGLSLGKIGLRSAYLYNLLNTSTSTNSLIIHTHPSNHGVQTIVASANNVYSVPLSTEGTEFETIDNILLDYLPGSGLNTIKGVMHKEQFSNPVGVIGIDGIPEGNIIYLNKYTPDNYRSRYETIAYFKDKNNPIDWMSYIKTDNLQLLLNQPPTEDPYSKTADAFKLMFGTTGIDGIYGSDANPKGLTDDLIADRRTKSLLYFKSILHALIELQHTISLTKLILNGANEWPALITTL